MKKMIIEGRIWVLTDGEGRIMDDIDTDMIFHNKHLHITDVSEMGKYALGNLEGWQDFPERAERGDIIIAGENFGCGSSRQQAVDCFLALGIQAIVAKSFGAIYKRNAINSALAVMEWSHMPQDLKNGDVLEIDMESGDIKKGGTLIGRARPMSPVQTAIYKAGGLFSYARSI